MLFIGFFVGCTNKIIEPEFNVEGKFTVSPKITPFYDENWLLLEDFTFKFYHKSTRKSYKITVPAGFITDLASVPTVATLIFDHPGRYASAGIIHDYLYWIQPCERKFADRIFRYALKAYGVPKIDRITMWRALDSGGDKAWKDNQKDRKNGNTRFIPEVFRSHVSPNLKWDDFRIKYKLKQTQWDKCIVNPTYCDIFSE